MKEKGFTLVELLAVIIILSLLLILVIPKINDSIKSEEKEVNELTKNMIFKAADFYMDDISSEYIKLNGNNYCIKVNDLVNAGYLKESNDLPNKTVKATYNNLFTYELVDESACEENTIWLVSDFAYTGDYEEYIVPVSGYYRVELWGAQGGNATYTTEYVGGKGAYTSGVIYLEKGEKINVTVGGVGHTVIGTTTFTKTGTGYNGGAPGSAYTSNSTHGGGGGATDVRYNETSLQSRIMVAAGGGGASSHVNTPNYSGNGGPGGSLYGGNAIPASTTCYAYGMGASQVIGGGSTTCTVDGKEVTGVGSFGLGYSNKTSYSTSNTYAGGGAGYYGGGGGLHAAGGGGSSFISGYAGVNAIESELSLTQSNNTLHYSGKYFIDGEMISGENSGNGKAKITFIGSSYKRTNTKLNGVRYVKQCSNGNTVNTGTHLVELQAIYKGKNIAKGKNIIEATGKVVTDERFLYSFAVDGDINNFTDTSGFARVASEEACFIVDLEKKYNLDEVASWFYWPDNRTYNDSTLSVSSDSVNWIVINENEDAETSQGVRVSAYE